MESPGSVQEGRPRNKGDTVILTPADVDVLRRRSQLARQSFHQKESLHDRRSGRPSQPSAVSTPSLEISAAELPSPSREASPGSHGEESLHLPTSSGDAYSSTILDSKSQPLPVDILSPQEGNRRVSQVASARHGKRRTVNLSAVKAIESSDDESLDYSKRRNTLMSAPKASVSSRSSAASGVEAAQSRPSNPMLRRAPPAIAESSDDDDDTPSKPLHTSHPVKRSTGFRETLPGPSSSSRPSARTLRAAPAVAKESSSDESEGALHFQNASAGMDTQKVRSRPMPYSSRRGTQMSQAAAVTQRPTGDTDEDDAGLTASIPRRNISDAAETRQVVSAYKQRRNMREELNNKVPAMMPANSADVPDCNETTFTGAAIPRLEGSHQAIIYEVGDLVCLSEEGRAVPEEYNWAEDALRPGEVGEVVAGGRDPEVKGPRGNTDFYSGGHLEKADMDEAVKVVVEAEKAKMVELVARFAQAAAMDVVVHSSPPNAQEPILDSPELISSDVTQPAERFIWAEISTEDSCITDTRAQPRPLTTLEIPPDSPGSYREYRERRSQRLTAVGRKAQESSIAESGSHYPSLMSTLEMPSPGSLGSPGLNSSAGHNLGSPMPRQSYASRRSQVRQIFTTGAALSSGAGNSGAAQKDHFSPAPRGASSQDPGKFSHEGNAEGHAHAESAVDAGPRQSYAARRSKQVVSAASVGDAMAVRGTFADVVSAEGAPGSPNGFSNPSRSSYAARRSKVPSAISPTSPGRTPESGELPDTPGSPNDLTHAPRQSYAARRSKVPSSAISPGGSPVAPYGLSIHVEEITGPEHHLDYGTATGSPPVSDTDAPRRSYASRRSKRSELVQDAVTAVGSAGSARGSKASTHLAMPATVLYNF